jgi:hypothetical protein
MWSIFTPETAAVRIIVTFLACGVLGVGLTEGIRAANHRENTLKTEQQEEKHPPAPVPNGPTVNQDRGTNSPIQIGDHNTVNYNLGNPKADAKLNAKLDDIKKLIESQSKEATEKELLKKYPLGYVIFDVDHKNEVVPYAAQAILDKYELDWSGVGVSEPSGGGIIVKLPGLKAKDGSIALSSASTGGPKKVGYVGGFGTNGLQVSAEILAIGKDGIVFLVGFDKSIFMPHPAPSQ